MEKTLFDNLAKVIALTVEEEKAIADIRISKEFKKGTILLKEGQHSDIGYFVIKGCLRCYYTIDGNEKTTAFYTENEAFEPQCKIDRKASTYFVACVEDSTLIVSDSEMERAMFQKIPKLESVCRLFTEELLAKNKSEFDRFKTSSPEQRYLDLIENRPDLLQRVPQYQIANYLGITAQSLSRMRSRLSAH